MTKEYQIMAIKEQELKAIALEVIPENVIDRIGIAQQVVQHFIHLTPPEIDSPPFELVTVQSNGQRGGTSRKPGNLFLSWTGLLQFATSMVSDGLAALDTPWLLPFVALHIWSMVRNSTTKELSPRHAMILLAMWEHRDRSNKISEEKGLKIANEYLKKYGAPELTEQEFVAIINDLCAIDCVVLHEGIIWLRERIEKRY